MNRLLAILVTLFILFLVYLWINHLMGSSQRPKPTDDSAVPTDTIGQFDESEEVYTIPDDDVPADTNHQTQEGISKTEETESTQTESEKAEPETKPETKPAEQPSKKTIPLPSESTPKPAKTVDKDAGAHLVIAGNFLTRANAEERVRELKKLGYNNAEVVNFELSEYHTACAGRYTDLNEARRIAKKIKDQNNIDTYVRHGN